MTVLLTVEIGKAPKVYLTADGNDFDPILIQHFGEEGYDVKYLPYDKNSVKAYRETLKNLADDLELGEKYSIVGTPTHH